MGLMSTVCKILFFNQAVYYIHQFVNTHIFLHLFC